MGAWMGDSLLPLQIVMCVLLGGVCSRVGDEVFPRAHLRIQARGRSITIRWPVPAAVVACVLPTGPVVAWVAAGAIAVEVVFELGDDLAALVLGLPLLGAPPPAPQVADDPLPDLEEMSSGEVGAEIRSPHLAARRSDPGLRFQPPRWTPMVASDVIFLDATCKTVDDVVAEVSIRLGTPATNGPFRAPACIFVMAQPAMMFDLQSREELASTNVFIIRSDEEIVDASTNEERLQLLRERFGMAIDTAIRQPEHSPERSEYVSSRRRLTDHEREVLLRDINELD